MLAVLVPLQVITVLLVGVVVGHSVQAINHERKLKILAAQSTGYHCYQISNPLAWFDEFRVANCGYCPDEVCNAFLAEPAFQDWSNASSRVCSEIACTVAPRAAIIVAAAHGTRTKLLSYCDNEFAIARSELSVLTAKCSPC